MARIIVLQYEDNDEAADLLDAQGFLGSSGSIIGTYYLPGAKVYCRCDRKPNLSNFRNHKKFGLKVCTICGRPSIYWRNGIKARLEVALGKSITG